MEKLNATVHYWNIRGLAEPIRYLLAACKVDIEDKFFGDEETEVELGPLRKKGLLQFGQVPLVQIDNLNLVQSGAIMRYLANRLNMYGDKNDYKQKYLIDTIYESTKDARQPINLYENPPSKQDLQKKFNVNRYVGAWEKQLINNNKEYYKDNDDNKNDNIYIVGTKPSIADITVYEVLSIYQNLFGNDELNKMLKDYPNLAQHYNLISKMGNLKDYQEKRLKEIPSLYKD